MPNEHLESKNYGKFSKLSEIDKLIKSFIGKYGSVYSNYIIYMDFPFYKP